MSRPINNAIFCYSIKNTDHILSWSLRFKCFVMIVFETKTELNIIYLELKKKTPPWSQSL